MIRPATMFDAQQIVDLAVPLMAKYPLMADVGRTRDLMRLLISSRAHFAWVADNDGAVTGALLAATGDNAWAKKKHSAVLLWLSRTAGDGAALLRKYRDWVLTRPVIRVAGFSPDINDIDPRAWKLAERIGFERHGGSYLLFQR
jgi:hypothetical protein